MYTIDPKTFLAMVDQDRERAMAQNALERAARAGGEQHPGIVRGGIAAFGRLVRQAGTTLKSPALGGPRATTHLDGAAGI